MVFGGRGEGASSRRCGIVAGVAALLAGLGAAPAAADGLSAFLAANRCRVADGLRTIAAAKVGRDPFLILAWPRSSPVQGYVQCLFNGDSSAIYCEAESGALDPEIGPPSLAGRAALARLGFDMEAGKGNFTRRLAIRDGRDIDVVAELMLSALYGGYDGAPDRPIQWVSPNASEAASARRCATISLAELPLVRARPTC